MDGFEPGSTECQPSKYPSSNVPSGILAYTLKVTASSKPNPGAAFSRDGSILNKDDPLSLKRSLNLGERAT